MPEEDLHLPDCVRLQAHERRRLACPGSAGVPPNVTFFARRPFLAPLRGAKSLWVGIPRGDGR